MSSGLHGGRVLRTLTGGRAAQASLQNEAGTAPPPQGPSATKTSRLSKNGTVGRDGGVVVELNAAIDLEPGFIEPAKTGWIDPHQEIVESAD